MTYGSVLASFNVEEFGTERVARLTREEIDERFEHVPPHDGARGARRAMRSGSTTPDDAPSTVQRRARAA